MHLVDQAREYIEARYKRPLGDRALRWILARILPYPMRFRVALLGAKIGRPFARLMPDARLRAMLEMAPKQVPPVSRNDDPQTFPAQGVRRKRVALMTGCAQRALNTDINDATIRLLTRLGCEVVVAEGAGCCGALTHHMGKTAESHATAAKNIRAWTREMDGEGLDAIVINTSGCGTTVKDYGHMFRLESLAGDAKRVSDIAMDVSEVLMQLDLPDGADKEMVIAYHAAISKQLKDRKIRTLEATNPDVIAAGNIGCMMQIGTGTGIPVVHTVELLDWACGGPKPRAMARGGSDLKQVPILR
jgi:glycolate oxidase iron-sulfur subunit